MWAWNITFFSRCPPVGVRLSIVKGLALFLWDNYLCMFRITIHVPTFEEASKYVSDQRSTLVSKTRQSIMGSVNGVLSNNLKHKFDPLPLSSQLKYGSSLISISKRNITRSNSHLNDRCQHTITYVLEWCTTKCPLGGCIILRQLVGYNLKEVCILLYTTPK